MAVPYRVRVFHISPNLLQVNMVDWTFYSRYFYTILVNWMGGKAAVLECARRTSCGQTAMELLQREIREECLRNALKPREIEVQCCQMAIARF